MSEENQVRYVRADKVEAMKADGWVEVETDYSDLTPSTAQATAMQDHADLVKMEKQERSEDGKG